MTPLLLSFPDLVGVLTERILRKFTSTSLRTIAMSLFLIGQIPYGFPVRNYAGSMRLSSTERSCQGAAHKRSTEFDSEVNLRMYKKQLMCHMTSVGQSSSFFFSVRHMSRPYSIFFKITDKQSSNQIYYRYCDYNYGRYLKQWSRSMTFGTFQKYRW